MEKKQALENECLGPTKRHSKYIGGKEKKNPSFVKEKCLVVGLATLN
jgi:hypothetical protein